ncbi:MAG: transporter, partial [Mariniblastus sp.]|nr:transporter [Mariniblastus sp.]
MGRFKMIAIAGVFTVALLSNQVTAQVFQSSVLQNRRPLHGQPMAANSDSRFALESAGYRFASPAAESKNPFDEPIETDRHDFTQSAKVVGKGVRQLEYGMFYSTLENGVEREITYAAPEILLRVGLSERTEFRTRFNYAWKYNNEEEDFDGGQDMIFGLKYQLSEPQGRRPESAVELRLSAPTGADSLSTGRWEPGIDYIYTWE